MKPDANQQGPLGAPTRRVDGRDKVTGRARYAGEFQPEGMVYGVAVPSPVARGRVTSIDAREALARPEVLQVFTHENAPKGAPNDEAWRDDVAPMGSPFRPLHGPEIRFAGQPVALVVATTFEAARSAAMAVRVHCAASTAQTDRAAHDDAARPPAPGKMGFQSPPKPRGDYATGIRKAAVTVDATYTQPCMHHNPMEPHATTVEVQADGRLLIHDKTQGVANTAKYVQQVFGLPPERVRVVTPFVGGGFGSGLRPQYQTALAVMAALALGRSVRVVLTRQQMFTIGYRPETRQRVVLGADADGRLVALYHDAVAVTSRFEDYCEVVVNWSSVLYDAPNTRFGYGLVPLDLYTPIDARAPGAATGMWAIESAMDELAAAVGVDPVELRLCNYTERDPDHERPFSSKALRSCYRLGAERFGWSGRDPKPGSMRRGDKRIGWGMATGIWETSQQASSARARLTGDGRLYVGSATSEIGPGTYTVMTQIAAEALGLAVEDVRFELGDTALPDAVIEGGSMTVASVGPAVRGAVRAIGAQLFEHAQKMPRSPFADAKLADVVFADRALRLRDRPEVSVAIHEVMRHAGLDRLDGAHDNEPDDSKQKHYTRNAHSAVFVEVEVDDAVRMVRVSRVVIAAAAGRILNPTTARSQVIGGAVWGIGHALHEKSVLDHRYGRFVNHDLAEYHVPVNADVGEIEVVFVDEHDDIVNDLGAKGIGELGIVGVAAAIANAIHHATGKRVRDLPIELDSLL
ncbi:MAG: xanthine dehydrogenase family protein molybdopterin-binding subunit [bacterium]